jgi:hypothetical protein
MTRAIIALVLFNAALALVFVERSASSASSTAAPSTAAPVTNARTNPGAVCIPCWQDPDQACCRVPQSY